MRYRGKKYNRVCYVGSIYALLVYLCYSSMEEIQNTFFIMGHGIDSEIANRLEGQMVIVDQDDITHPFAKMLMGSFFTSWIYLRYLKWKVLPKFDGNEELYVQDFHLLSSLVCNRAYNLVEDGAGFFMNVQKINNGFESQRKLRSTKRYKLYQLLYGKNYCCFHGDSPFCKKVIITRADDTPPYLDSVSKEVFDINNCWHFFSEEKKSFILKLYDITDEDVSLLKHYNVVFFTQPLYKRAGYNSYLEVIRKLIDKYRGEKFLIKTHQTDDFDYESHFPEVPVFRKKIPSQLIDMLGIRYQKVITFGSASVCNYNYPVEVDWYGYNPFPSIYKSVGDLIPPKNATICKI